jgi:hypothetical protein
MENKIYNGRCSKCGGYSFYMKIQGNNTGLYCSNCGRWIKWLNKDERRAFEHSQNNEPNIVQETNDIVTRLNDFVRFLDKTIDDEMSKMPLSPEDSIRKNSYCLALEKDKNAIINILNGNDFNYVES